MRIDDEQIRKVLDGLRHCEKEPETIADCGDCPYRRTDTDEDFCLTTMCREAIHAIVDLWDRDRQAHAEGGAA